jgi:transcriptional regulator GlxA family with amidase domain
MVARGAARRVVVVAFDGVRFLDVVGPLEVFAVTNEQGPHYQLQVATPGGVDVRTTTGTRLGADCALETVHGPIDTLLVAGSPDWSLLHDDRIVTAIERLARRVASVCTGSFALAAAGLLNGRRAGTHWRHAASLAREHPQVIVDADALFVRDEKYFTCGGISAGIDLALALVEDDLGPDTARTAARVLVVFLQRPGGQSQFSARDVGTTVRHSTLRPVLDSVALDPAADHSLTALASRAGFSERHLTRLFADHLQLTPAQYVEQVRVEAARGLLERGDDSLDVIARHTGFGSAETMRRAFVRHVGIAPGAYRSRFRSTGLAALHA